MANWNQPSLTDTYANFLAYLDARLDDLAYGLDPALTTVTNAPTSSVRWNSATNRWEKYNGTAWAALSSSYAIDISGNAATATTLATARTINGTSFNGSANITVTASTTQAITFNNGGSGSASGTTFNGGTAITISYNSVGAPKADGTGASGTWSIAISGNAGSVTNGVYTTGDQTIGGVKSFSAARAKVSNAGYAMWEMEIPGAHARGFYLDTSGVVRLSTTNGSGVASTSLLSIDGSGNGTFAGDVTAYSDERLKQNWRDLPLDFIERLARVKMGIYDRKDSGHTQVGVGAQSLRDEAMPMAVLEGAGGILSVSYGNAALAACVALAREVLLLKTEIAALKG
jgi:hypothetical protein